MFTKLVIVGLYSKASLAALIATATFAAQASAGQIRVLRERVEGVPQANPVVVSDNVLAEEFALDLQQQGLDLLENPSGAIARFGYLRDAVSGISHSRARTEPDENTYLILDHNPGGPTIEYDYGRHFLFQGHENGDDLVYITRINLDVSNPDHRVTLLTPPGEDGLTHFNSIDGSTWNPFSQSMLFTQERGNLGGVIEVRAASIPAAGVARACTRSMAAWGGAAMREFIRTIRETFLSSKMSAGRSSVRPKIQTRSSTDSFRPIRPISPKASCRRCACRRPASCLCADGRHAFGEPA